MISELSVKEYGSYFAAYISKASIEDVYEGLKSGREEFLTFLEQIPEEKIHHQYAEDKWTIAEVILHVIDTERIFAYRALRFSRNDRTKLTEFDQDKLAKNCNASKYTKKQLMDEFATVRNHSISLFKTFDQEMLCRIGRVKGNPMSARAAGYIMVGHQRHHIEVMKSRYLS